MLSGWKYICVQFGYSVTDVYTGAYLENPGILCYCSHMRFAVVGSGSCGNSYIFKTVGSGFVVDNGYSCLEFCRRAKALGFDPSDVKYIFLTHVHRDHIAGVEKLSRKFEIPVFVAEKLYLTGFVKNGFYRRVDITPGLTYNLDDFSFTVFPTFHDAPNSVGYSFSHEKDQFTIITDTGKTSPQMRNLAEKSNVIFLESNYCPDMLRKGPYPPFLQERILSDHGHLSNYDALDFVKKLSGDIERKIYLCHISDKNNSPERVKEVFDTGLPENVKYYVCRRGIPVMGEE